MTARPSPVLFATVQKLARMSLCLCGGALMLAATAQPGFAATAGISAAITSSPAAASAPGATLADARRSATPARARPLAPTANPPAAAHRLRIAKTAGAVHRLRRTPAMVSAPPYRVVSPATYRAGCSWFSCGRQISWLFLGVGF